MEVRLYAHQSLGHLLQKFTGCVQAEKEHKRLRDMDDAKVKGLVKQKMAFEPRWCDRIRDGNLQIGKQYLFRYKGCYWEERAAKSKAG